MRGSNGCNIGPITGNLASAGSNCKACCGICGSVHWPRTAAVASGTCGVAMEAMRGSNGCSIGPITGNLARAGSSCRVCCGICGNVHWPRTAAVASGTCGVAMGAMRGTSGGTWCDAAGCAVCIGDKTGCANNGAGAKASVIAADIAPIAARTPLMDWSIPNAAPSPIFRPKPMKTRLGL